ncbi:hypothetical protein [Paenibacillus spongiae]|uniref:Uncharacterized protein n=1 Tax=Paenibacillus spongiae TaxID=2909671 RepID=A0ABY5S258_9BACL|nr:hypothetical protein [Paenibacillus spongiae]UVI27650.1 hypothetical protein L1F29_19480 [Paenibacillus spongiae]
MYDVVIYLLVKMMSVLLSVFLSAVPIGFVMGSMDGERLFVISLVSAIIVLLFGVPLSMVIDLICKSNKGGSYIAKMILHGAAGALVAGFVFTDFKEWMIFIIGIIQFTFYYMVYAVIASYINRYKRE